LLSFTNEKPLFNTFLFDEFKNDVPNQMSVWLACRVISICSENPVFLRGHQEKNQKFFKMWEELNKDFLRVKGSFFPCLGDVDPEVAWDAFEKMFFIE